MKQLRLLSVISALLISLPASAHFIWLEQADGQTKLYFGEYEGGLREKTGGRLDTIATPEAMTLENNAVPLTTKRATDYIAIEGANNKPVIAHDLSMKVKDMTKYHFGIAKPMYYARIGTGKAEGASSHVLDIQPLGDNKVRISLNGKPLAKAKLKVIAPNQWLQELDADGNGEAQIITPWAGLYVLEVIHLEPVQGSYQNEAYENIRHVSTLSWMKNK
jgi:uncharacterized GH25 family protein